MKELSWRTRVYVVMAALAAAVVDVRWLRWQALEAHWAGLALLSAMWAVFNICNVRLPVRGTVSVNSLIAFLSITAYGPQAGLTVVLVGSAFSAGFARQPWYKSLFNAAQFTLSAGAAAAAYSAAGGFAGQPVSAGFLLPYYALAGTHLIVNCALLSLLFFSLDGQSPWRYGWSIILRGWPNVVASLFAGIFLQAIYMGLGLVGVLFISLLLLGMRFTFKLFADAQGFYLEIVRVLTHVLEVKDPFTSGHSERVAQLAAEIGREMGFVDQSLELLKNSARMHDIGKVAIPDSILVKPGPLTAAERMQMDLHVDAGDHILGEASHLRPVSDFVAGHHEHFDGSGYPRQLEGEQIPLAARIIAAADAFDAMVTDRPYRSALPLSEVMIRLQEGASYQFDPSVLAVLFRLKGYDPESGILQTATGGRAVGPAFRPLHRIAARGPRSRATSPDGVAPGVADGAAQPAATWRTTPPLPRHTRRTVS